MQFHFARIPVELKILVRWICWQYVPTDNSEKPTKVPYNVRTGLKADITDRNECSEFQLCVDAVLSGRYSGIGICLFEGDGKLILDLDYTSDPQLSAVQQDIYAQFNSYSERSPSKTGLHIICDAEIPKGCKRGPIEMYSSNRFMTMTGDVYNDVPIAPRQGLVDILYGQMTKDRNAGADFEGEPVTKSDDAVMSEGVNAAVNGPKFLDLYNGHWQQHGYPSQSEADFAFIDMLANYTKNKEQVRRLFMASWLAQRDKAQKRPEYVNAMVHRAFDRYIPPLDFSNFGNATWKKSPAVASGASDRREAETSEPTDSLAWPGGDAGEQEDSDAPEPNTAYGIESVNCPTGLMGMIANFIYGQSYKPVEELAVTAAISLMAGICGRQYNTPTGAGLNLYTILVAQTAIGKEAMSGGIDKLIVETRKQVPAIDTFLGPATIASGPALLRKLEQSNCFLSIVGEFGHLMQNMCAKNAPAHMVTLRQVLLDTYAKSGKNRVIRPSAYSDKERNILDIHEPALSILGESTPSTFYETIDENLVSMGLISRLLIVEYRGKRVATNPYINSTPSPLLCRQVGALASYVMTNHKAGVVVPVQFSDEARALSHKLDVESDNRVNSHEHGTVRDLWSRAHLSVMKLASLLAISDNYFQPVISVENWKYAEDLVLKAVNNIVTRFKRGEMGKTNYEPVQLDMIDHHITRYINKVLKPQRSLNGYNITPKMLQDGIVPFMWFASACSKHSAFNQGYEKGSAAVRRALKTVCDIGTLVEVDPKKRYQYGSEKLMYQIRELPHET